MLALPTLAGFAVSRKCVGSLLVRVRVRSAALEGGAAFRLMLAWVARLLPTIGIFNVIPGMGPTLIGAVIVAIPGEVTVRFAEP